MILRREEGEYEIPRGSFYYLKKKDARKKSPPFRILRQVTPGILNTITVTKAVSYSLPFNFIFSKERGENLH